jgi:BirA family biotin operon repressor/biotin-[acetyl-CoA-carboxylase] ligase
MKKNIKIGSVITFIDSVDSTNNYTAKLINENKIENGQVIMADFQGEGRGQRGATWHSERGKNILASVYLELDNLSVKNQTLLIKYTAVSLLETLKTLGIQAKIKWPNDILVDDKKICGILIENQLIGLKIKNSIIGFGLNVNQEIFELDRVTSLKLELAKEQERMSILGLIINRFNQNFDFLNNNSGYIEDIYLKNLYRIHQRSTFHSDNLGVFNGTITGVDSNGMLLIRTRGNNFSFDVKEIKFCSK